MWSDVPNALMPSVAQPRECTNAASAVSRLAFVHSDISESSLVCVSNNTATLSTGCSSTNSTAWAGCNPDTQLSLDYFLMENYDRLLGNLANPMSITRDVRRGLKNGVIANCNGLWVDGACARAQPHLFTKSSSGPARPS